jgi:multisubunit Na+/H+ antiporter MnhE subunit
MLSRLILATLWLAVFWVWLMPLAQPRGHYLGRYAYADVTIGIPLAIVTLWVTAGFLLPSRYSRPFAVTSVAVVVSRC